MLTAFACACALALSLSAGTSAPAPQKHDLAFWQQIVQADGALPAGMSADALSDELSPMLGNRDPVLRDDVAYTLLATWLAVKRQISDAQARRLVDDWVVNLRGVTAATADIPVLLRSFSALSLAAAVARDNDKPYLEAERYRAVLAAAIEYFDNETDTRGFDPTLGWVHATAHTSDLLKFLARNRLLAAADQRAILRSIARKVSATDAPWVSGEDERIGRVLLALAARPDVDWTAYESFLSELATLARFPEKPSPATLARYINAHHLLTATHALLSTAPDSPGVARAREQLLKILRAS